MDLCPPARGILSPGNGRLSATSTIPVDEWQVNPMPQAYRMMELGRNPVRRGTGEVWDASVTMPVTYIR